MNVSGTIDHQQLQRLVQFAVDRLGQDLRLAHRQLEAFAPHHLDQDGQLQFAAAHHLERVRSARFLHANRNVGQQFLIQAVAQIARRDVGALRGPKTARC